MILYVVFMISYIKSMGVFFKTIHTGFFYFYHTADNLSVASDTVSVPWFPDGRHKKLAFVSRKGLNTTTSKNRLIRPPLMVSSQILVSSYPSSSL